MFWCCRRGACRSAGSRRHRAPQRCNALCSSRASDLPGQSHAAREGHASHPSAPMSALWLLAVVKAPISGGTADEPARFPSGLPELCRLNASRNATGEEYVTMSGRSDCGDDAAAKHSARVVTPAQRSATHLKQPGGAARQARVQRRLEVADHGVARLQRGARAVCHEAGPGVTHPHAVANQPQPQRRRRPNGRCCAAGRGGGAGERAEGRRVERKVRRNLRAQQAAGQRSETGSLVNSARQTTTSALACEHAARGAWRLCTDRLERNDASGVRRTSGGQAYVAVAHFIG